MRGPRHRWWRPLVARSSPWPRYLAIAGVLTGVFWPAGLVPGTSRPASRRTRGPSSASNLLLAALIPATLLGLWVGHRRSPWRVLSVTGRIRWRWLLRCTAVVTPVWAAYLTASWVVFDQEVLPRSEQWVALVVGQPADDTAPGGG